jgi:hypothetical protein
MFKSMFQMTKARLILDCFLVLILLGIFGVLGEALLMPGSSYHGKAVPLTQAEKVIEEDLREEIQILASDIGERNSTKYAKLNQTCTHIETAFKEAGYKFRKQQYKLDNTLFANVEAELLGCKRPKDIIVVGAHYDSVIGCPGANDNGSGIATVIELAKLMARKKPNCTLRFVLFSNEEPPYFGGNEMGSYQYVQEIKKRNERVIAMLDMETLAFYTEAPHSQTYPSNFTPFYPDRGNFVAFVGNRHSRPLTEACMRTFRDSTTFPSEGVAVPEWVNGVDWADHKWFWQEGIPAVMITDTAVYRYPHYHTKQDTADKLNYPAFAKVVGGLRRVVEQLADEWNG